MEPEFAGEIVTQDGSWSADALTVLELLANEAPIGQFESLVAEARRRGVSGPELELLERAKGLGLSVHAQLDRRQQREAGLFALVETARDLAMPYDLDTLLKVITRRARTLLGLDMSYIGLPDEEQGFFYVRTSDGHTSTLNVGLRLPDGTGLGSDVLTRPAPFWTPDYLADERIHHNSVVDNVIRAEGLRAILAVPLSHGSRPYGVLYAADRSVRHFSADEISLMSSLGDLAGVAIEKARLLDDATATVTELQQNAGEAQAGLRGLRELGEIHAQLIDLVLAGCDLTTLAREAARRLGGALRVRSANGTVLTTVGSVPEDEGRAAIMAGMDAHAAREPVPLDNGLWAAPVLADHESLGTLTLAPGRPFTERDERLLGLVAQATAVLLMLHSSRTAAAEGHVRDELLDDLLADRPRPPRQLERRATRLGLDLSTPHVVVVARPEGEAPGKASIWASSYAHRLGGLKTVQGGSAVMLLPGGDAGEVARAVADELTPLLGHPVTVAAAGPVTDTSGVAGSHQEALRCLDAMTALGATGRAASARELGFLGVLLSDNHDVEGFIDSAIGPVLDYDRQRFTELTRTLEVYFDTGGSPTYAAKELHVHPNTVARRLERIGELLGAEWQKPDRALEVQLALRLSRVRRGPPRRRGRWSRWSRRGHRG
ncbi:GAF domain-containing protein, partial [Streptomyces sp. URMC 123]|uniref:GAF domain-containing protein n=1 Tax=Streptomyces sp. URMC 123 TaxID=3423403 RepID=UPI003F529818